MTDSDSNLVSEIQAPVLSAKRAIWLFVVYFLLLESLWFIFGFGFGVYSANVLGNSEPQFIHNLMAPYFLPISIFNLLFSSFIVFRMTRKTLPGSISQGALSSIGWVRSLNKMMLLAGFVGIVIALSYFFIILPMMAVPDDAQSHGPLSTAAQLGGWQRILWVVIALLLAPPIEEFVFRGVLFSGMSNAIGVFFSAVITSIIFVAVHYPEARHYWPAFIGISLLALATIFFRIKTKSFIPAIAVHFSYNLVVVIMVYLHAN